MCCHFMFTTCSFKSFFAIITGPCPLVTCRIQTVFWTDVLAILSVVQTIALGTFPGDRLTGPTTLTTSSTVWSKVIRRAYCNKVNFHIKYILFCKGNVKQNLEFVHYLNCIWFSEKPDLFQGRRYYPTTRITKRLLAAGKNDW